MAPRIRDVPISSDSIRLGQFLKYAGMIDSGDSATTRASGMSSVRIDPQLPDTG